MLRLGTCMTYSRAIQLNVQNSIAFHPINIACSKYVYTIETNKLVSFVEETYTSSYIGSHGIFNQHLLSTQYSHLHI